MTATARGVASDAVASAAAILEAANIASPDVDAELLLGHVMGVPRLKLRLGRGPTTEQLRTYDDLVARRASREPLQHLIGTAAFRYLDIEVGRGVFVPRPETEVLAGWAIDVARCLESPIVVDLCTGSGAIAASIATEVPSTRVYAVELDETAFGYAQRNLADKGVEVRQGDIAAAFADLDGTVDVVVANPPYIPLDAWESVDVEARDHDPALALWSGHDGLDAIRVVEQTAYRLLKGGGVAGCEHADAQGDSAPGIFAATGRWSEVRDNVDLAGRPRFVTAHRGR